MKMVYLKVKAKEKGKERVRAVQSRAKHQVIVLKIQNQFYSKSEHLKVQRNCTEIFLMTTKMVMMFLKKTIQMKMLSMDRMIQILMKLKRYII